MSVIDRIPTPAAGPETAEPPVPEQERDSGGTVTLYRRRAALALVGTGALAVAVAFAARAATDGPSWGLLVAAGLVPLAVLHLAAWVAARDPLLVADRTGLRVRSGRRWTGLRWEDTVALRLTPARAPRRDGRLVVLAGDGPPRQVPLGLVDPSDVRALPDALRSLAGARTEVTVETAAPVPEDADEAAPPDEAVERPRSDDAPPREPTTDVARADVVHTGHASPVEPPGERAPGEQPLRDAAPGRVGLVLETRDVPVPPPVPPPVIGVEAEPSAGPTDPVIGPRLAEARGRLRLSVDDLAERTRIRPHVIDAMEVDDFSSCGGDVYARGHLRTLARVLGIDAEPLVGEYDARYASAPVTARRVFEAELAGPGRALRPTGGGPRWSVLIAVVLVLALVWGVARLLVPPAPDGRDGDRAESVPGAGAGDVARSDDRTAARFAGVGERPSTTWLLLRGTVAPGSAETAEPTASQPPTAADPDPGGADAPVTVRSDLGEIVFRGELAPDEVKQMSVAGPATVSTPDAGAVSVRLGDGPATPLGKPGQPARTVVGD